MILVFGSLNIDLVTRASAIPGPGRTVLADSYERHFGGKGANQAVAAARLSQTGQVWMAGSVGADRFGDDALGNLVSNGVDVGSIARSSRPTGCAFITIDARGENAITVASGANLAARLEAIPHVLLSPQTVLVLQMEVPFTASLAVARMIRAVGGRVLWNLAPVPETLNAAMVGQLLEVTSHLIVNEHEAMDTARILRIEASNCAETASMLTRAGNTACVVTAGARGATAFSGDGPPLHASALSLEPIDTTGAGDTFVGAFAVMLAEGAPLPRALKVACEAASLACQRIGAQDSMPTQSALVRLRT